MQNPTLVSQPISSRDLYRSNSRNMSAQNKAAKVEYITLSNNRIHEIYVGGTLNDAPLNIYMQKELSMMHTHL